MLAIPLIKLICRWIYDAYNGQNKKGKRVTAPLMQPLLRRRACFVVLAKKITDSPSRKGVGYFFRLLTITIISPIKLTINNPKANIR